MENKTIFVPDWNDVVYEGRNDLVFETRNKEYGAYQIRKRYSKVVNMALAISVGFFLLCFSIPIILSWLDTIKTDTTLTTEVEVNLTEPPPIDETTPPPPPVEPPPPLQESIKFTPPEVKPDEQVKDEEPPPSQEDLKESNAGAVTQEGNGAVELPSEVTVIDEPVDEKPLLFAEQMAEFPGGEGAMQAFINSKAKYPVIAREAGIDGTVYLSFVIDKDGKVGDVKVLKDPGYGMGESAMNAVKQMPQWKPAKQNGRVVALQYTIPVKFNLAR